MFSFIFLEDVLRARLRTIGVQEYRFLLETGPDTGREWRIYDVVGLPLFCLVLNPDRFCREVPGTSVVRKASFLRGRV